MENLKALMEKYGSVNGENGLIDGVEMDLDPTVGVVENIINGENEETIKEVIESAVNDAEKLENISEDAEELEEAVDAEEKEEATTESAIRVITKIDETLEKHGYKTPEEKEKMGFKVDGLNSESAQSFPSATKDAAISAGKTVVAKIKEAIKWIIDKIVKAYNAVKDGLLSLLGNNAATARKLQGVLAGVEDKVEEGKEFKGDYASKFPLASTINKEAVVNSLVGINSTVVNAVIKEFTDGCSSKNLEKFNKLEGITGSKEAAELLGVDKAILIGVNGKSVSAIVVKDGGVKIETKEAEGKAPVLTAPLPNSDLKTILSEVILRADASKKAIEDTKTSFESLKNIKVEDAEFAKSAKIDTTVSMLTNAKMKLLDTLSKQPKIVLQFVAANIAVKAKKAA